MEKVSSEEKVRVVCQVVQIEEIRHAMRSILEKKKRKRASKFMRYY